MTDTIAVDPAAERAMVGAILLGRSEALVKARALVSSADLTEPQVRMIFEALERLHERGDDIDTTSVASEIRGWSESYERPTGYIAGLLEAAPSTSVETHARRVRYCATLRRIAGTANELAHIAVTQGAVGRETEAKVLEAAQKSIDALLYAQTGGSHIIEPGPLGVSFHEKLLARERRDPGEVGIETGYSDLDKYVAYRPGELWYIAASPGIGKTAFLQNLQDSLGRRGVPSLFASIEQPWVQLMDRSVAADAQVDSWKIARGNLNVDEWRRVHASIDRLANLPTYMYDDPSMTTARLSAILQLAKVRHDVRVCFVDYAQIFADMDADSEFSRVTAISRRLAHMARALNICVVAACQVSRQGAQADGQIPRLSELRQSGQLEQDAFVVLAMGRKSGETTTQVAIRENRSGQSDITIELVFDPEHTKFYSRAA